MPGQTWIFLDPDGTGEDWSYVIVRAATGVTYEQQCGGLENLLRTQEGYLVPIFQPDPLADLGDFFADLDGDPADPLTDKDRDRLAEIVGEFRFWQSVRDEGAPSPLALDPDRLTEIVEAWVPVTTPDGPGVLVWPNSD